MTGPGAARSLGDRAGYFSLPFVTGNSELPEIFVKMLPDGTFGPGAPVFYTSLTTLHFVLTVTDTVTGQTRTYGNDAGDPLCGAADVVFVDPAALRGPRASPAPSDPELRLFGGRFAITLEARHPSSGRTARGHSVFENDRFGYFSFPTLTGDAAFPEVLVKMIDGQAINGRFWLFFAGLTSLDYTLTVTDRESGDVRAFESSGLFCGSAITDLSP